MNLTNWKNLLITVNHFVEYHEYEVNKVIEKLNLISSDIKKDFLNPIDEIVDRIYGPTGCWGILVLYHKVN